MRLLVEAMRRRENEKEIELALIPSVVY